MRKQNNSSAMPKQLKQKQKQVKPTRRQRRNTAIGRVRNNSIKSGKKQSSAAVAYSTGQSSQSPSINSSYQQSRIVHRELIASIVGTSGYSITAGNSFALNPGIASTFPWLSTQAVGWEQYHFNKLKFCYYTRAPSSTAGSVQLIPDYDAADAPPFSEQIASAYEDTSEDVPWKDIECSLSAASMHPDGPKKYIRTAPLVSNLDIKTYDVGNLFVATTDGSAVNWGKLWVEYDVVFHTPQLPPSGVIRPSGEISNGAAGVSNAAIFGTVPILALDSPFVTASGNILTFLVPGYYLLVYQLDGTSPVITAVAGSGSGSIGSQTNAAGTSTTAVPINVLVNQTISVTVTGVVTAANVSISDISAATFAEI
jgi:hypothetical protein